MRFWYYLRLILNSLIQLIWNRTFWLFLFIVLLVVSLVIILRMSVNQLNDPNPSFDGNGKNETVVLNPAEMFKNGMQPYYLCVGKSNYVLGFYVDRYSPQLENYLRSNGVWEDPPDLYSYYKYRNEGIDQLWVKADDTKPNNADTPDPNGGNTGLPDPNGGNTGLPDPNGNTSEEDPNGNTSVEDPNGNTLDSEPDPDTGDPFPSGGGGVEPDPDIGGGGDPFPSGGGMANLDDLDQFHRSLILNCRDKLNSKKFPLSELSNATICPPFPQNMENFYSIPLVNIGSIKGDIEHVVITHRRNNNGQWQAPDFYATTSASSQLSRFNVIGVLLVIFIFGSFLYSFSAKLYNEQKRSRPSKYAGFAMLYLIALGILVLTPAFPLLLKGLPDNASAAGYEMLLYPEQLVLGISMSAFLVFSGAIIRFFSIAFIKDEGGKERTNRGDRSASFGGLVFSSLGAIVNLLAIIEYFS